MLKTKNDQKILSTDFDGCKPILIIDGSGKRSEKYVSFICTCGQFFSLSRENVMKHMNGKYIKTKLSCGCARKNEISKYFSDAMLTILRGRAKMKDMEFDIDIFYLDKLYEIQEGKCIYTGEILTIPNKNYFRGTTGFNVSIDRIDSSKGYIRGNIVLCTKDINFFKFIYSYEEMLNISKKILNFSNIQHT